jgi:hypothetical protein
VQTTKHLKFHHSVYVVLFDNAVTKHPSILRVNPKRDPLKPCVYVGMTGLPVDHRFELASACGSRQARRPSGSESLFRVHEVNGLERRFPKGKTAFLQESPNGFYHRCPGDYNFILKTLSKR